MPSVPRDVHVPSASDTLHSAGKELSGFQEFILRGNVVDLAVGIVIGAAFGNVVQALVKDLITPLIGVFGGVPDFSSWTLTFGGSRFLIGDFLNTLISFLLIAVVVYFLVVLPVNRLMERYRPEPKPAPTKECPECLSKIPLAARRCSACAAQLAPPSAEVAEAMRQAAAPYGAVIADEAAQAFSERLRGSGGA